MALDLKHAIEVVDRANREPQELLSTNNRGADIRAAEVAAEVVGQRVVRPELVLQRRPPDRRRARGS